MKRWFITAMIISLITLISCCAMAETSEAVSFYEINGREVAIYLNLSDKKSTCEGGVKTTYVTVNKAMGSLKGAERYKGKPYAVSAWIEPTTAVPEIMYRANDTELSSISEGFFLVRRGLNGNGKRVDVENADFIFMAKLDREGRKYDKVDFVFKINGITQSITHIRVSAEVINYYLVDGDARLPEPKVKAKKSTTTTTNTNTTTTTDGNNKPNPQLPDSDFTEDQFQQDQDQQQGQQQGQQQDQQQDQQQGQQQDQQQGRPNPELPVADFDESLFAED